MTAPDSEQHRRLSTLLNALGAEPLRPQMRCDGLTETIRLNETDNACITVAGENAAIVTVVTSTERGRRLLKAIGRFYGVEPVGSGT